MRFRFDNEHKEIEIVAGVFNYHNKPNDMPNIWEMNTHLLGDDSFI